VEFHFEEVNVTPDLITNYHRRDDENWQGEKLLKLVGSNRLLLTGKKHIVFTTNLDENKPEISYRYAPVGGEFDNKGVDEFERECLPITYVPYVEFTASSRRVEHMFTDASFLEFDDQYMNAGETSTNINKHELVDLTGVDVDVMIRCGKSNVAKFFLGNSMEPRPSVFLTMDHKSINQFIDQLQSNNFISASFSVELPLVEIVESPIDYPLFGDYEFQDPVFAPDLSARMGTFKSGVVWLNERYVEDEHDPGPTESQLMLHLVKLQEKRLESIQMTLYVIAVVATIGMTALVNLS
jgi:hypothetical protein